MESGNSTNGMMTWTFNISSHPLVQFDAHLSDELLSFLRYILYAFMLSALCLIGVSSNILTIAVFYKMGYKETANISLTAIAFWDLNRCVVILLSIPHIIATLFSETLGISWQNVSSIVNGNWYINSGNVSVVLTAYVAVERCLCVCIPFTVKYLLTRKFVTMTTIFLSLIITATYMPNFAMNKFVEIVGANNQTFIIYILTDFHYKNADLVAFLAVINAAYPIVSVSINAVCTSLIVYQLRKATRIRNDINTSSMAETETSKTGSSLSSRDRKVIRMLIVIITTCLACLLPRIVMYIVDSIVLEFRFFSNYHNVYLLCIYIVGLFELVNSSLNFFIFFLMSSQFNSTLKQMFHILSKNDA